MKAFLDLGNPQGFKEYWEENPFKTLDEGTSTHVVAAFADGLESRFFAVEFASMTCSGG